MEFHNAVDWKQAFQSMLVQPSPLKEPGLWSQSKLPWGFIHYGFTDSYLVCADMARRPRAGTRFTFVSLDVTKPFERFDAFVEHSGEIEESLPILHLCGETFITVFPDMFIVCRIASDTRATCGRRLEVLCTRNRIFNRLVSVYQSSIAYVSVKNDTLVELYEDTISDSGAVSTIPLCYRVRKPSVNLAFMVFKLTDAHVVWSDDGFCTHYPRIPVSEHPVVTKVQQMTGRPYLCDKDPEFTHCVLQGLFGRARFFAEDCKDVFHTNREGIDGHSGTRVDFAEVRAGQLERVSHLHMTPDRTPFVSTISLDCVVLCDCRFVYVYDVRAHTLVRKYRHGQGRSQPASTIVAHPSKPLMLMVFNRGTVFSSNDPALLKMLSSSWGSTPGTELQTVVQD